MDSLYKDHSRDIIFEKLTKKEKEKLMRNQGQDIEIDAYLDIRNKFTSLE